MQNLTGQKFGQLIVIEFSHIGKSRHSYWLCRCDCGNKTIVARGNLVGNKTKSCGCLRKETSKNKSTKHGLRYCPLYSVWNDMIHRCYNPKCKNYLYYGKRGIAVCDEWRISLENFIKWAEANGYKENLEIDRINNDGDYEPTNCRWIMRKQNNWNRGKYSTNKSGYKGVSLHKKTGKWQVKITKNGQSYFLGLFDDVIDAAHVYDKKARELFGAYTNLNFSNEQ